MKKKENKPSGVSVLQILLVLSLTSVSAILFAASFGSSDSGPNVPVNSATDNFNTGDTIYVTNYRDSTVGLISSAGSNLGIFGRVSDPVGLTFDNAGNLYVASDNPAAYAILKFAPNKSVSVFANSGLNAPHGIVFDNDGNLYVANAQGNTIEKFTPDGVGSVFADASDGLRHPSWFNF